MKWTALFLFAGLLQANARGLAQGTITLSVKKAALSNVFSKIQQQSGYAIWYDDALLEHTRPVDLDLKEASLPAAMDACCRNQPIVYTISGKMVIIQARPAVPAPTPPPPAIDVRGTVVNEKGEPLAGATITVKGSQRSAVSDNKGVFELKGMEGTETLLVTNVGYEGQEIALNYRRQLVVMLHLSISKLDEVQVIGYGTTTKRLSTGSVSRVSSEEIEKQPVTNVLSALSGRAAGVFVQTTNGLPGGNINIQIRGKGSIAAGTDPLYVVDGVPYPSAIVSPSSALASGAINGATSPLNSLNPDDIESITILKDADATAIYGSRGANGVVLIETKKGKAGIPRLSLNISEGINTIASLPRLMNLREYLQIRREAFHHDRITPSANPNNWGYAPDLMVWDTTQATDWGKFLLGGTGHVTDIQSNYSGGVHNTSFSLGGNFHRETTILPGSNQYQRGGFHFSLHHISPNKKFTLDFANSFSTDKNQLANPSNSTSSQVMLPPNYPLYDNTGQLNWYYVNPLGTILARNRSQTENMVANLAIGYHLFEGLTLKTSIGYNKIGIQQTETFPKASLYPGSTNYSYFGDNSRKGMIIEPQATFSKKIKGLQFDLLAGLTYQSSVSDNRFTRAESFNSESLMENIGSAGLIRSSSVEYIQYRYVSSYGKIRLNWRQKYLFNFSGRRDGSSRFGPGRQFGDFGAIGAGWVFSNEKWIKERLPLISFGKIRASFGITGNDQIPDYQYLSTYSNSGMSYQDTATLKPSRLANSDFHWESTKKTELAIELGFFKDRLLVTVNGYLNRSDNQLVAYTIPAFTGFSSYQANLPAVVQNSGWEIELSTQNIRHSRFDWSSSFNLTLPKNRLNSFPRLESSSYANLLVIGEEITRAYGTKIMGLDSVGKAIYAPDPGGNNPWPWFYFTTAKGIPDFFGGIGNTFRWKNWQLDIFGQFTKQRSRGGLDYTPGVASNNYRIVLERWQSSNTVTTIPAPSTSSDFYYGFSTANYFNASYFRLKNISITYQFPAIRLRQLKVERFSIYVRGQNLATWWDRRSALFDPESGTANYLSRNIPPMRTFKAGFQIVL